MVTTRPATPTASTIVVKRPVAVAAYTTMPGLVGGAHRGHRLRGLALATRAMGLGRDDPSPDVAEGERRLPLRQHRHVDGRRRRRRPVWGWPALILTLKPTLLPFALLGANRRAWWRDR